MATKKYEVDTPATGKYYLQLSDDDARKLGFEVPAEPDDEADADDKPPAKARTTANKSRARVANKTTAN